MQCDGVVFAINFVEAVCQFQGCLQKMSREGAKQTMIDRFINPK